MDDSKISKIPFKFPVSISILTSECLISRTINPKYEILGVDDKGSYTINRKDGYKRYLRFRKMKLTNNNTEPYRNI